VLKGSVILKDNPRAPDDYPALQLIILVLSAKGVLKYTNTSRVLEYTRAVLHLTRSLHLSLSHSLMLNKQGSN